MVDVVSNVWTVKAFPPASGSVTDWPANWVSRLLPNAGAGCIWKARLIHDAFLWIMAGSMLLRAITLWRAGPSAPVMS